MKKVLIVSTVSRQFYLFEQGNIEILKKMGYEVHAAANFNDRNDRLKKLNIIEHHFDIERSPFSYKNIKAYKQLKSIMKKENFDIVHCHSPMGGFLGRISAKKIKVPRIIYTAHGFHFFKGAPLLNWLLYYPLEKMLSKWTNTIITINNEDFKNAKNFYSDNIEYVPGIGIDSNTALYDEECIKNLREELSIESKAFVICSVGELNDNKNHEIIIRSLAKIKDESIVYIICGKGENENYLKKISFELGLKDNVKFLGFRNDVIKIYKLADVFVFPSRREGLSVSLMEAMVSGLPVICSKIRGNIDLIVENKGGILVDPNDSEGFVCAINSFKKSPQKCKSFGLFNMENVKKFDKIHVNKKMKRIYSEILHK